MDGMEEALQASAEIYKKLAMFLEKLEQFVERDGRTFMIVRILKKKNGS